MRPSDNENRPFPTKHKVVDFGGAPLARKDWIKFSLKKRTVVCYNKLVTLL